MLDLRQPGSGQLVTAMLSGKPARPEMRIGRRMVSMCLSAARAKSVMEDDGGNGRQVAVIGGLQEARLALTQDSDCMRCMSAQSAVYTGHASDRVSCNLTLFAKPQNTMSLCLGLPHRNAIAMLIGIVDTACVTVYIRPAPLRLISTSCRSQALDCWSLKTQIERSAARDICTGRRRLCGRDEW